MLKNRDEALKRGRAMLNSLAEEADALRAVALRYKSKLDMASGQHQLNDAALAAARKAAEQQMESQLEERAAHEARLEDQQRQTLEAIAAVSGLESKLRRQEADVLRAKEEVEQARREAREFASDSAGLRKAREELAVANKKAMEAQSLSNKERNVRAGLERELADLRATHEIEVDERKRLTEEVQRLKSKLIAAENALERMPRRAAPPTRR
jgi:hypothetical protein